STIEEAYARSMTKLAKSAGNFSQLGTFAPVWDVVKTSTEKLASCHMELVRKLQELIKEVQKYVEEQAKAHKKTKEEVASTLEAVQNIQTTSQALQKSKEIYNAKTVEQERLRKEGATQRDVDKAGVKAKKATETYKSYVEKYAAAKSEFEQKMAETAQKFQDIEENHTLHMKEIIQSYSQSVEETHVQIGEVSVHTHGVTAPPKGSQSSLQPGLHFGKDVERQATAGPIEFEECNTAIATEGAKPRKRKPFGIPGRRKDKDTDSTESTEVEAANTANGAPPGYYGAIDIQNANVPQVDAEGFCIRPEGNENDILYAFSNQPSKSKLESHGVLQRLFLINVCLCFQGHMRRNQSRNTGVSTLSSKAQGPGDELAKPRVPTPYELTNNDLLSLDPFGPSLAAGSSSSVSSSTVPLPNRPTTPLTAGALVPPPRPSSRPKLPTGKLTGINEIVRPFSPPKTSNASPPPAAPLARAESSSSLSSNASLSAGNTPTVEDDSFIAKLPTFEKRCETPAGTSRGPSPVTLASQDALPIAVAFTESVNAYFKGADPTKCIVKITGDMTLSFPMGIIKVFTSNPSPAVLTFKLKNTSRLEQILPNQQLLYSDPSQSDSNSKDFWFNMQALTSYLRKASDQNPTASYYNVDILKYQVSPPKDVSEGMYFCLPPGAGSLRAKFELSDGPSSFSTLAVQFMSEGSTLSGADMELVGAGYRLSLNKKRFATGRYMADC
ncbi:F-BAR domain only protein 2, partial [Notothenia coriiceps]|uniref:F-BAR domain only protein 2 n=1 Tax=Notothenia coriiceps TaxID=8208 RepID=A0A6I9PLF4_9TELE